MNRLVRKTLSLILTLAMVITVCPQIQLFEILAEEDTTPYCISAGRPVYASSQNGGAAPEYAVDGDELTRWQAGNDDKEEWFYVDLGKKADIDHIYIKWEDAYAKSYQVQFSDDESNWKTVYTRGKGAGTGGEVTSQAMSVSRSNFSKNGEKNVTTLSWTELDGVDYYYIYLDDIADNTQATAADGYPFGGDWGTRTSSEVWVRDGNHTYTVVAYGANDKEIARASIDIDSAEIDEETTVASGGQSQNNLEHTITFDELSESERQARYVRIRMTERALEAYGCSFFEFQVFGDNGVVKRPAYYGTNLALNQPVTCSGIRDEWWMKDDEGNLKPAAVAEVQASNAVDGKAGTSFTSYQGDDQWIYVDLGKKYTVGRIIINWNADAGKIYDVEVSGDAKNWTKVHRITKGYAYMQDNFTLYQENVRYVRVFGYTKVESGSGFGIYELSVYEYREGDSKENETLDELPTRQIVNNENGKGSYITGEMYNEKNKLPTFINKENIKTPIDSNSWWSSIMIKPFGNLLCATPLKAGFEKKGLGIIAATAGWVGVRGENDLGTNQSTEILRDFYISPENLESSSAYDRVENYGDYSVEVGLMDGNGLQMKSTIVKGSPYIFNEFCDNTVVFINGSSIKEFFDGKGNAILANKGDVIPTDHIGFKTLDEENTKAKNDGSYFVVNVPEGTTFKTMVAGSNYKIKITFPSKTENYMSVAAMTKKEDIDSYYTHGYAFVKDTYVGYTYNKNNSKIVTTYKTTTELKRSGFSNVTMQAMFPHQWKYSTDDENAVATYTSIRGDMKAVWANEFTTTQQFAGLLPTFATPESEMFDSAEMIEYLNAVVASKINTAPVDDAYWEGKNVHPLAISIIMADQLGETEIKDKLLKKLKSIMEDWLTYDGGDDKCYLIYNKDWGTVYYPNSAYGANAAICDHHFTYGYFMYGAAVLATYDKQFLNDYRDMVEILVRDYANPKEPKDDGNMFCKFRAFDQYAGHSWAGGYADNDDGNNQESASEALFSWVGMYLWGEATQNQTYIDAGAYGFTTEMEAVLQYWFDYDETNWLEEYPFEGVGQIYGGTMGYGTFFGGQPTYVYGIQWLPISEYLTNYGMNQEKCAKVYAGLEYDTQYAIDIETRLHQEELDKGLPQDQWWHNPDTYVTPDNGWQHITWPFLSQTDPQRAYEKFSSNVTKVQTEDRANTLWFISAMDQLGYRTTDYAVIGNIQGSVYVKDTKDAEGNVTSKKYTAQVWNPTETTQTVTIIDKSGKTAGTAKVGSRGLVSFNIDTESNFALTQVATPVMKATSLAEGTVKENVSGEAIFEDTQIVELSCDESGATIYYTTDGTTPTTDSSKYEGKFIVSSNTTVKAIAVKEGYINSAYASTAFVINGDKVESSNNLALGKNVTASSENGGEIAANIVDGNRTTRWQAKAEDDADSQWIQIDLGSTQVVNSVKINWEAAYAAKYQIQTSLDGDTWETVAEENGLVGEITSSFAATKARYVRMQGISRGTQYGYSLYEMEVYGALKAQSPTISPVSGTYEGEQTVTLSTTVKGAEIKYTLDGSEPTEDSATYTAPITITKSTIVKAITYRKGMILSDPTESSIVIAGTIALNKTSAKIATDRTIQLSAMTDETVTWSSSNASVATVDDNGLVTGKTPGTTVITAKAANGKTATCDITVTEPIHISSIGLSKTKMEMKNKTSETLELKINPSDTTDDTTAVWTSSDEKIVVVNENGTLTAKSEGIAQITVKVGTFTAICEVTVGPAATTAEMAASPTYNVALKKNVFIYPGVAEGDVKYINDGALTADGNHCALSIPNWGYTGESYVTIDLGDYYDASTIDLIAVQYKDAAENDTVLGRKYVIEYSENGIDYTTVYESDTVKAADFDADMCVYADVKGQSGAVRYVKIYYPQTAHYGIQISEIAILSTEQNLKKVTVEHCDNPADFIVTSDNLCEITYTITPGKGQEDYKYIVYLDGIKKTDFIDAGTYVIKDVTAGIHKVQVVSYYDKKTSEGITKEVEVDDGSLKGYVNTARNLSKGATVTVDAIEAEQQEGSKDPKTLVDGVISKELANVVETTWGNSTATIVLDLGNVIAKDKIDEVLIAFKANNTNATAYNIEFSSDGINYEKLINVTGAEYKDAYENKFDAAKYSQNGVRYVRINLTGGNYTWGYQISEVAIMGTEVEIPTSQQPTTQKPTETTTPVSTTSEPTTVAPTSADVTTPGTTPTTPNVDSTTGDSDVTTRKPGGSVTTTQTPTKVTYETSGKKEVTTPGKAIVKKVKAKKKGANRIKLSLKKINGAKGYQVAIYKNMKYAKKNKKAIIRKFVKKIKPTIKSKKLKNKKKLYIRVRAYVSDNMGKKLYGKWSKVKKIKIKK